MSKQEEFEKYVDEFIEELGMMLKANGNCEADSYAHEVREIFNVLISERINYETK